MKLNPEERNNEIVPRIAATGMFIDKVLGLIKKQ